MRIAEEDFAGKYRIRAYGPGRIDVNEFALRRSFVISPGRLIEDWPPQRLEEIASPHISALLDLEPEIVLLGTGRRVVFPAPAITAPVMQRGIGIEIMDTAAACRTFNVLASEGRKVVAGILVIAAAEGS